jgi:hypothetical protein
MAKNLHNYSPETYKLKDDAVAYPNTESDFIQENLDRISEFETMTDFVKRSKVTDYPAYTKWCLSEWAKLAFKAPTTITPTYPLPTTEMWQELVLHGFLYTVTTFDDGQPNVAIIPVPNVLKFEEETLLHYKDGDEEVLIERQGNKYSYNRVKDGDIKDSILIPSNSLTFTRSTFHTPFDRIIELDIAYLNLWSEFRWSTRAALNSTLVFNEDKNALTSHEGVDVYPPVMGEQNVVAGSHKVLFSGAVDVKPYYLSPDPKVLSHVEAMLDKKHNEILATASLLDMTQATKQAQSGIAIQKKQEALPEVLTSVASILDAHFERMFASLLFVCQVEYNHVFRFSAMDPFTLLEFMNKNSVEDAKLTEWALNEIRGYVQ